MCELCRARSRARKRINKAVNKAVEKQVKHFIHKVIHAVKPTKLVLFFDRIGKIISLNNSRSTRFDVEPMAYTPQEFAKLVAEKNSFVTRALREGIQII